MERFTVKKRKVVTTQDCPLALLFNAQDILQQIARMFVATEFERPSTTADYVNLGLTCTFLANLLLQNPPLCFQGAVLNTRAARTSVMRAIGQSRLNSSNHLTWRVTFETDLCVLVFYRHGIVGEAVQIVACEAANMLAKLDSAAVQEVIDQRITTARFFGSVSPTLTAGELIDLLRSGRCRIETIMFVFQCMGFFLAGAIGLPELPAPSTFRSDRLQVTKLEQEPALTQCLGITDRGDLFTFLDLPLHSSALGRVQRSGARKTGFGQIQDSQGLPLVGGPSGSSRAIYSVAVHAGLTNPEHIRQFILATIAFLVGGGQHSIDEVLFGLPDVISVLGYTHGKYLQLLPDSLTHTYEWNVILRKYQRYLDQL